MEVEEVEEEWIVYQYQYETTEIFSTDFPQTTMTTAPVTPRGWKAFLIGVPVAGVLLIMLMLVMCAAYRRKKSHRHVTQRTEEYEMTEITHDAPEMFASTTWPSLPHKKPANNGRVDIRTYFDENLEREHVSFSTEQPQRYNSDRRPSSGNIGRLIVKG